MLILGTPRHIEDYVLVDNNTCSLLYNKGFLPEYKDENWFYFRETENLLSLLSQLKGGEK